MLRLCSNSSRPYPGRSVSRAMRFALQEIPDNGPPGTQWSRHNRLLSPDVSELSIVTQALPHESALQGNLPGDEAEVSRGHSSQTPGVMPGTW
jgi:hypothetical protein